MAYYDDQNGHLMSFSIFKNLIHYFVYIKWLGCIYDHETFTALDFTLNQYLATSTIVICMHQKVQSFEITTQSKPHLITIEVSLSSLIQTTVLNTIRKVGN